MTAFQLPTYQAPASGWSLSDYKPRLILTATADATGKATTSGPTVDPGFMWLIQRAVVSSSSSTTTQARLYDGDPSDLTNLMSGSNSGGYDEGDYPLGLLLDQSRQLTVQWVGASTGAHCVLRLQIAVLTFAAAA